MDSTVKIHRRCQGKLPNLLPKSQKKTPHKSDGFLQSASPDMLRTHRSHPPEHRRTPVLHPFYPVGFNQFLRLLLKGTAIRSSVLSEMSRVPCFAWYSFLAVHTGFVQCFQQTTCSECRQRNTQFEDLEWVNHKIFKRSILQKTEEVLGMSRSSMFATHI